MKKNEPKTINDWDRSRLLNLADDHGTPLYVTDLERVRHNYEIINNFFTNITVNYAAKANTEYSILRALNEKNCGVECASIQEAIRAHEYGYNLEDIQVSLINPSEEVIEKACKLSNKDKRFKITVGSLDAIDKLLDKNYNGQVFLRVSKKTKDTETFGKKGALLKFGIPHQKAEEAINMLNALKLKGIHTHIGGQILTQKDLDRYGRMIENIFNLLSNIDYNPEKIDLGGGLGVPYKPEDSPLDLSKLSQKMHKSIPNWYDGDLIIEPGRYIVSDASILLTEVNTIKKFNQGRFVGVDAGMTDLIRPAAFNSYHPIKNISSNHGEKIKQTIAGPTCSGADIFAQDRKIRECNNKEIIAIGNVGAYGYVLSSNFHSYPRNKSVVIDGNKVGVSRERETLRDVKRQEVKPKWLR